MDILYHQLAAKGGKNKLGLEVLEDPVGGDATKAIKERMDSREIHMKN